MWSSAEITYKAFEDLCTRIGKATNGRLEIQPFAAGAVVGLFETLEAVQAGALQGQSTAPVYFTGKDAGFVDDRRPHLRLPASVAGGRLVLLQGRPRPAARGAMRASTRYCVGVSWWGLESIVSKRPIRNMADFKGIKIRSPQGINADILTKLGACDRRASPAERCIRRSTRASSTPRTGLRSR